MVSVADDRDPVAAFRAAAERYVAVVEAAEGRSPEQLATDFMRALPVLYEAGLRLPNPDRDPDTPELPDTARLTHDQWKAIFHRLQIRLGVDTYWTLIPFDDSSGYEHVELLGSLADDLADIYRDVKEGIDLLAAGESENDVVWEWRFGFWSHWGTHAVDALRVIHRHIAVNGDPGHDL
jgi:hypothetical protein